MRQALILLTSLLPAVGAADTIQLTWTQPTLRVDGSPLTEAEISGYKLEWTVRGDPQAAIVIPKGTSYVLDTGTLSGKTCVTLRTIDTDGLESDPTGQVCRNAKPNPPSNVRAK